MKMITTKTVILIAALFLMISGNVIAQTGNSFPCQCDLAACPGSLYNISYPNNVGWTTVDSSGGKLLFTNGALYYNSVSGGSQLRTYLPINSLLLNANGFVAETKIKINDGNAPGHHVMTFTANNNDPICYGPPFNRTNNDALGVVLLSQGDQPSSSTCCQNPCASGKRWMFKIMYKESATVPLFSDSILVGSGGCTFPLTYYVRLIRYNSWAFLGVYTDSAFTNHVQGSPICKTIPLSISNFRHLQHGVIPYGSFDRRLDMIVDDTKICTYGGLCQMVEAKAGGPIKAVKEILTDNNADKHISITPNPSSGTFKLKLDKTDEKIISVAIYDITGKIYKLISKVDNEESIWINANELKAGVYMVEAYGKTTSWKTSIVIQR